MPTQSRARRGARPRPILHRAGACGLGKNHGAHAALPAPADHGRGTRAGARDHVHAQGRRRNARARAAGARRRHAGTIGCRRQDAGTRGRGPGCTPRRVGWGLEDSAARLRIQTIDSFNAYLANAMPLTSGSGFGRGIADAPEDLYALAARETLRHAETDDELRLAFRAHPAPPRRQLDAARAAHRQHVVAARRVAAQPAATFRRAAGAAHRGQPAQHRARGTHHRSRRVCPRTSSAWRARWRAWPRANRAEDSGDAEASDLSAWLGFPRSHCGALRRPATLARSDALALRVDGSPRSRFTKADGLPASDPDAKALGQDFAEQPRIARLVARSPRCRSSACCRIPCVPEKARGALDALAKLLLMAAAQLTRIFNEQGECDHPEVAGAARQALTQDSSPTPLAERLGTRIRHILVDEFQDTSRDQYDLLLTLTQDWSEGDGRTLFLVGDPMQSIYGFRNAEVGRFSTVRGAGLGAITTAAAGTAAQFPLGTGAGALVQRSVRAGISRRGRRAPQRRAASCQCRRAHRTSKASLTCTAFTPTVRPREEAEAAAQSDRRTGPRAGRTRAWRCWPAHVATCARSVRRSARAACRSSV